MAQSISQEAIGATGLPGATAASRHAGATASGAPVSGTFAVGDFIVDQTGLMWVCTAAGTPGTWVQVGGSSGAPGTTVSNFRTTSTLLVANTAKDLASISLTAGTWLINAQANLASGTAFTVLGIWVGPTSASATNAYSYASTAPPNNNVAMTVSLCVSVVLASTTTVYLTGYSNTNNGSVAATDNSVGSIQHVTGITAVRTA